MECPEKTYLTIMSIKGKLHYIGDNIRLVILGSL
jgi:hypothetical protein